MSLYPSCSALLDVFDHPATCPGCRAHVPGWVRVPVDGMNILTHDGDVICPADPTFGALAGHAPLVSVESTAVAA
ncbi:hypothetical protein [Streptomyces albogriseolus]|uniref:hypothetical protein n=1 Tax=Streptomyces albogriseolus TaxID=1887 RepID=UPI003460739B